MAAGDKMLRKHRATLTRSAHSEYRDQQLRSFSNVFLSVFIRAPLVDNTATASSHEGTRRPARRASESLPDRAARFDFVPNHVDARVTPASVVVAIDHSPNPI